MIKGIPALVVRHVRAIQPGEDDRSGRWWWEEAVKKECGLHVNLKDKNQ